MSFFLFSLSCSHQMNDNICRLVQCIFFVLNKFSFFPFSWQWFWLLDVTLIPNRSNKSHEINALCGYLRLFFAENDQRLRFPYTNRLCVECVINFNCIVLCYVVLYFCQLLHSAHISKLFLIIASMLTFVWLTMFPSRLNYDELIDERTKKISESMYSYVNKWRGWSMFGHLTRKQRSVNRN